MTSEQNRTVQIPIHAQDIEGLVSISLTVSYNSNVLTFQGARSGDLTNGWSIVSNSDTANTLRISAASPGTISRGVGSLLWLDFLVKGAANTNSALTVTAAALNNGLIPTSHSNGTLTVKMLSTLTGTIQFWKNNLPVPGVELPSYGQQDLHRTK